MHITAKITFIHNDRYCLDILLNSARTFLELHISFCIYKSVQGKLLWRSKRLDTFNKLDVKKTSKANLEGAITSMRTFRFLPPLQSHIASFLRDGTIFD